MRKASLIIIAFFIFVIFSVASFAQEDSNNVPSYDPWANSCEQMGGNGACDFYHKCIGELYFNTSDFGDDGCCKGTCEPLSKQELFEKFKSRGFQDDEAMSLAENFYVTGGITGIFTQKNLFIFGAGVLAIILIFYIIQYFRKKKSKKAGILFLALFILILTAPNFAQAFRFVVISDTHKSLGVPPAQLAEAVKNTNPEIVLHAGDFSCCLKGGPDNRPYEFRFQPEFDALQPYPIFPVRGNHDTDSTQTSKGYLDFWSSHQPNMQINGKWAYTYSFDYGGYHFVMLDIENKNDNINWLKDDLKNNNLPTIIVTHITAVPIDKVCGKGPESYSGLAGVVRSDKNIVAVFSGDKHCYLQEPIGGSNAVQVISGSASSHYPRGINPGDTKTNIFVVVDTSPDGKLKICSASTKEGGKILEGGCEATAAGAAPGTTAPQPQPQFQNCQPGAVFGGGVLNTDLSKQGLVPIPEIDGKKICTNTDVCFSTPGDCCVLKEAAVKQLYPLYKLFKDKGCQLTIPSPYRSLQKYMEKWDASKNPSSNCPPRDSNGNIMSSGYGPENFKQCPHYNGVAIDIWLECGATDKTEGISYEDKIKIACEAGWVNYHHESWHFEFGTNKWKSARAAGLCQWDKVESDVLYYPFSDSKKAVPLTINGKTTHQAITVEELSRPPVTDPSPYITQPSAPVEQKPQPEVTAPQLTMPSDAISFKQVSGQFGGINVIEVDPNYFDVKTMSAKTMIEDIGKGTCGESCKINIVEAKKRFPELNIIAGVNAGFFAKPGEDEEEIKKQQDLATYVKYGRPQGLYIENGFLVMGAHLRDGYFIMENGVPKIITKEQFSANPSISSAVNGLLSSNDLGARLTAVCITSEGKVKLITTNSAAQINAYLDYIKQSENCVQAMDFDGGGSTQFYYEMGGIKIQNSGTVDRPVANFLVVVPKGGVAYGTPTICPPLYVTNSPGSPENEILYAAYNVRPSFAVEVDKDFSDYGKIKTAMMKYLDSCSGEVNCMSEKVSADQDFNDFKFYFKDQKREIAPKDSQEKWEQYCENPDQEFLNDFVGFYQNCRDLPTTDSCKCTFDYSKYPSSLNNGGKVSADVSAPAIFKARLNNYDYSIQTDSAGFTTVFPSEITKNVEFVFKIGDRSISNPVLYKNPGTKELSFRGMKGGNMLDINGKQTLTPKNCPITSSNMLRVCAVSKNTVYGQDPISTQFKQIPLVYRFALQTEDLPPPPVENVNAEDLIRAKDSALLSWTKVPPTDIAKYRIYSADADFKDKKPADQVSLISKEIDPSTAQTVFKFLGVKAYCAAGCTYKFNVIYKKDSRETPGEIEIKDGTFIYDETTNKYFYANAVPDEKQAFYGVTAVDKKQQESPSFLQTPGAISADDIPPAIVAPIITPEAGTITLSWARPSQTITSSELKPDVGLQYDIYKKCQADTEFTILQPEMPLAPISQLDANCNYKVIAKRYISGIWIPSDTLEADKDFVKYLLQ